MVVQREALWNTGCHCLTTGLTTSEWEQRYRAQCRGWPRAPGLDCGDYFLPIIFQSVHAHIEREKLLIFTALSHRCNVCFLCCLQQIAVKFIINYVFVLRQNASLESLSLLTLFFFSLQHRDAVLYNEPYLDCLQSKWSLLFPSLSGFLCHISQEKENFSNPVVLSYRALASNEYHLQNITR